MPTIPDDLAARWSWHGPFLVRAATPDGVGLAICATTFPPPACFASARFFDLKERECAATRTPHIIQERLL